MQMFGENIGDKIGAEVKDIDRYSIQQSNRIIKRA